MKISKFVAGATLLATGYFIGFLEVRYRTMKMLLEAYVEKTEQQSENTNTEE